MFELGVEPGSNNNKNNKRKKEGEEGEIKEGEDEGEEEEEEGEEEESDGGEEIEEMVPFVYNFSKSHTILNLLAVVKKRYKSLTLFNLKAVSLPNKIHNNRDTLEKSGLFPRSAVMIRVSEEVEDEEGEGGGEGGKKKERKRKSKK